MRFNNLVAVIAITTLAAQANAYSDGTLRRSVKVAQNDTVVSETIPSQGVVIMNSNSNTNSNSAAAVQQPQAVQQPTTVVEAAPVSDSRADLMRRARQNEEVKTEQKIVEKLEESRLREEQQRAERLFGDRLDTPAAAAPVVTPAPAPAPTPTPAPVVEPAPVVAPAPTQVTIEKVEIVQPTPIKEEIVEPAPAPATSKLELDEEPSEPSENRFFVGGILGSPNYNASNVKSNFGLGVSVGTLLPTNWAIEGSFLYSNHSVDTYWQYPLYRDLDQYDLGIAAKYYILSGRLKPYVGGSATYIYRKYQDRTMFGDYWNTNPTATEEDTHSVNAGLTAGVDFAVSESILLGAGVDYNFNLMSNQDFHSQYAIPTGVKALEEIDYTVIKVNAKMLF